MAKVVAAAVISSSHAGQHHPSNGKSIRLPAIRSLLRIGGLRSTIPDIFPLFAVLRGQLAKHKYIGLLRPFDGVLFDVFGPGLFRSSQPLLGRLAANAH
jgi:hypothetical protein